ncbi:hypothetical protein GOV11_04270 [Candidatus Woesearchaeota archaeon]|nr:hypothetical protein [Candidatus Woesearchaeota archaeon]
MLTVIDASFSLGMIGVVASKTTQKEIVTMSSVMEFRFRTNGKKIPRKARSKEPLKNPPKKCSVAFQICLRCQDVRIRKNDLNYELKICKECVVKDIPAPLPVIAEKHPVKRRTPRKVRTKKTASTIGSSQWLAENKHKLNKKPRDSGNDGGSKKGTDKVCLGKDTWGKKIIRTVRVHPNPSMPFHYPHKPKEKKLAKGKNLLVTHNEIFKINKIFNSNKFSLLERVEFLQSVVSVKSVKSIRMSDFEFLMTRLKKETISK